MWVKECTLQGASVSLPRYPDRTSFMTVKPILLACHYLYQENQICIRAPKVNSETI
jgi:hypothetical protein